VNAVSALAGRARALGTPLADFPGLVFCVGPTSAEAARREGLPAPRVPERRHDAEGLLAEIEKHLPPAGRRFLMPRGASARERVPAALAEAGGSVEAPVVYRTLPAEVDAEALRGDLVAGRLDALTFTSPSTVKRFAALLDDQARAAAARCIVVAIGPVTAEALRHEGFDPDAVAETAGAEALVESLVRLVRERAGGTP
jgi:uroporphyrinogen-III synthase